MKMDSKNPLKASVMHMLHSLDCAPGEVGSTVRLGTKWLDKVADAPFLVLCVCSDRCLDSVCYNNPEGRTCENCSREGTGEVLEVWSGKFFDIPARLIEMEHEVRSRLYSGLKASMTKAYQSDFNEDSLVTVVTYERWV